MTKRWMQSALMSVTLIILADPVSLVHGTDKDSMLTIVGPVIAYDRSVTRLTQLTFVPNTEVLIVRVDKLIKGKEQAHYLKVVYRYGTDEPSLAKEIFDSTSQWRFKLKRDRNCDSSVGQMKSVKIQTEEGEEVTLSGLKFSGQTEGLTDDTNLPCYVLTPGDYRAQK
ncbi:MAG TPA: hypothetical protein VF075_05725 [Pyrinomonadaceae bacterium]